MRRSGGVAFPIVHPAAQAGSGTGRLICLYPRSRGYGRKQRILSYGHPLIPGLVNTHSITDEQMVVLDAMHLEAGRIVYGELHEHHRRKERKHHGCRGRRRRAFIPGDVPVMIA
jgi:hypothetical protein